jgi:hypothetical protein
VLRLTFTLATHGRLRHPLPRRQHHLALNQGISALFAAESFDSAMENSGRPETSEFAAKMAELCDGPVIFHNLDLMWEDTGNGADNG